MKMMENKVLEYIRKYSGYVNVVDIADHFHIGFVEAASIIGSLTRQGKVRKQDAEDNSGFLVAVKE